MKSFLFIFIFFVFAINSCKTKKEIKSSVIVTIDGRDITIDEFRSFYNFDVNFGLDSSGVGALRDELYFYIDQIKAKMLATEDGLIHDSLFVRASNWEKRQAMLRQLYRLKVSQNVVISEKEMRDLYINEQQQVNLRHLFFKSEAEAWQAYNQLSNGKTFEEIALSTFKDDSLAKSGGNLKWIKLSELDDELASALLTLPVKSISRPLKSKWGYHIVEILDKKHNPIISESEYLKSVPSLTKKIKARKSQMHAFEYIKSYIGELNPQLNPNNFEKIWNIIIPKGEQEKVVLSRKVELTQDKINKLKLLLNDVLDQPFISYKGSFISMRRFLTEIDKIPASHRFIFNSRRELSNQIGKWVRDELLLKEASRENLDKHERVLNETNRFIEEQSYYYYQSYISDTMSVPQFVNDFYKRRNPVTRSESNQLSKYRSLQEWKFEHSKKLLHDNLKKIDVDLLINNDLLQNESKRVNWDIKIRMFMTRKPS